MPDVTRVRRSHHLRNGYRDRTLDTRLGSLQLRIPKLRQGTTSLLPRASQDFGEGPGGGDPGSLDRRFPAGRHLVQPGSRDQQEHVSKLCKDIDDRVNAFDRPLAGDWPIGLDATYLKQREAALVSVAAIIAVATRASASSACTSARRKPRRRSSFLVVRRGLQGVKLVISDAHEGLKAAIRRVMGACWQRCRVHWMRNALSYVPKGQQSMASAALRQAFIQPDRTGASQTLRHVADQLRVKWPKLGAFIDDSEIDVLSHMDFPVQHRSKIHSTNPLERLNKEVKRRADVVGIFPNEGAIIRLIGAVLLEANDEWQLQHRYMQTEAMAELAPPVLDVSPTQIATVAA